MSDHTKKPKNTKLWLLIAGIALICIAVVCIILFLINGQTTVTGNFTGKDTAEYLTCESHITPYSLFDYDESESKTLKITATFNDNKLSGLSLIYSLKYDSPEKLNFSEAKNHAALNTVSQKEGLGPDAYNAKYSKLDNTLQLTMFAQGEEITTKTPKYFMLKKLPSNSAITQEVVSKAYAEQGLKCEKHK